MALKANRIDEVRFGVNSLTSNTSGNINIFTSAINGTLQSAIWEGTGNYTSTGSIIVYESGTLNTELFNISGVSVNSVRYPIVIPTFADGTTGSATNNIPILQHVVNGPLRIIGSGLGANKSGLNLMIRFN